MKNRFFLILLSILLLCTACTIEYTEPIPSADYEGSLRVHFVDVGQADCEIIELPNGKVMMIDAGNNDDSELITDYLERLNITHIDYLVGTHPHEDHIGSLDTVITNFGVGQIFMPDASANTKTYHDVIKAIEESDAEFVNVEHPMTIYEDEELKIVTVAPVDDYSDLNNQSIVVHLTYKASTFLFTGDAEEKSEKDITADIEADVLKVCHHGSSTSSSEEFLKRVDPMYAVISCGKNNEYGHPHSEVIERLYDNDITVYRTDEEGTLICTTEGGGPADYSWESEK